MFHAANRKADHAAKFVTSQGHDGLGQSPSRIDLVKWHAVAPLRIDFDEEQELVYAVGHAATPATPGEIEHDVAIREILVGQRGEGFLGGFAHQLKVVPEPGVRLERPTGSGLPIGIPRRLPCIVCTVPIAERAKLGLRRRPVHAEPIAVRQEDHVGRRGLFDQGVFALQERAVQAKGVGVHRVIDFVRQRDAEGVHDAGRRVTGKRVLRELSHAERENIHARSRLYPHF